jgi:hypothetical protein
MTEFVVSLCCCAQSGVRTRTYYRAIDMSPLTVVSKRSWARGDLHESNTTQFAEAVSSDGIITVSSMVLRLWGSSISRIHHRRSKDSKFSFSRSMSSSVTPSFFPMDTTFRGTPASFRLCTIWSIWSPETLPEISRVVSEGSQTFRWPETEQVGSSNRRNGGEVKH